MISKIKLKAVWPLLLFILVGCYVRRAPDETIGKDLKTPVIYKDTLASDKKVARKKKIPKKTFFGYKTRKAFTKLRKGRNLTLELFFVLKKPADPGPYVQQLYWFNRKKRKVMVGPIPEKEKMNAVIMHGPYKKIVNRFIIEEGQFFLGSKHGRWETYQTGEESILADKKKYYKGFPKDAEITYYDAERTKTKEVLPMEDGRYQGDYYFFSPEGILLTSGKYEHGVRIGIWKDFYDNKKRKIKRNTQYPESAFVEQFEPFTLQEYDEKGFATYDKAEDDKKKAAEKAKQPKKPVVVPKPATPVAPVTPKKEEVSVTDKDKPATTPAEKKDEKSKP